MTYQLPKERRVAHPRQETHPRQSAKQTRPSVHQIEINRESFRFGFWVGLGLATLVMCLIMFLWVLPTMDACVANMQAMQGLI